MPVYLVRLDPIPAGITVPPHKPEIVVLRSEVHHPLRTAEPAPPVNCPVRHGGKAAGGQHAQRPRNFALVVDGVTTCNK